jgi:hypothetical protein
LLNGDLCSVEKLDCGVPVRYYVPGVKRVSRLEREGSLDKWVEAKVARMERRIKVEFESRFGMKPLGLNRFSTLAVARIPYDGGFLMGGLYSRGGKMGCL